MVIKNIEVGIQLNFRLIAQIELEEIMNTIFLFIVGLGALSGLLAVMIYLLAVSREMQMPD
jgi:hypothetical protein